jgi:hypothetical protein
MVLEGETSLSTAPHCQGELSHHESQYWQAPITRRKLFTLLGRLLLVLLPTLVLCEGMARLLVMTGNPPQSFTITYDQKAWLAQQPLEKGKPAIFVMGDSLPLMAVYSDWMTRKLEQDGYSYQVRNLGSLGNTPYLSTALLEMALKKKRVPSLVLFNINHRHFNRHYYRVSQHWQVNEGAFRKSYMGQCLIGKPHRSLMQNLECTLKQVSYLARYHGALQQNLQKLPALFLDPKSALPAPHFELPYVSSETSKTGWAAAYPVFDQKGFTQAMDRWTPQKLKLPENRHYDWDESEFLAFYRVCQKHHISLVLTWLPEPNEMADYYRLNGLTVETLVAKTRAMATRLNLPFLDFRTSDRQVSHYIDRNHLNVLGALTLTNRLTRALEAQKLVRRQAEETSP